MSLKTSLSAKNFFLCSVIDHQVMNVYLCYETLPLKALSVLGDVQRNSHVYF
jgi:hypothetical protein